MKRMSVQGQVMLAVLGTATGFLGGCGPETEAGGQNGSSAPIVEETDPLINGVFTTLRPEIGKLNFPGGFCTATLLTPTLAVMASHCTNYTSAIVSNQFTVTKSDGTQVNFPVVQNYAVGRGDPNNTANGVGNSDVAFMRLGQAVPATVATPTKLATALPASGTTATMFGYGCQNRSTKAGGGAKQEVQYTIGPPSDNLCPGDSGGPRVLGAPTANGAVFEVNSGVFTGLTGSNDLTADAVFYGTPTLAALNRFATSYLSNPSVPKFAFFSAGVFTQAVSGDFDGNGLADIALWDPGNNTSVPIAFSGDSPQPFTTWGAVADGPYFTTKRPIASFYTLISGQAKLVAGDFDGNGKTDLALVGGTQGTLPVAFSNGDGTFRVTNDSPGTFATWAAEMFKFTSFPGPQVLVGDFDGNGTDDIALIMPPGIGWTSIPVAFSNGNGTFKVTNVTNTQFTKLAQTSVVVPSSTRGAPSTTYVNQAIAGKFDGSAKGQPAGIALVGNFDFFETSGYAATMTMPVAHSNKDGSFSVTLEPVDHFGEWTNAGSKVVAADFDGDGKTDLAAVGGGVTGWATNIAFAFSSGGGHFVPGNLPFASFPDLAGERSPSGQTPKLLAGKFTHNKQADLVLTGGAGWTTIATAVLQPVLAQGARCTANTQCGTGSCVDGVCCGSSACSTCNRCDLNGLGTCSAAPTDPSCAPSEADCRLGCSNGKCAAAPIGTTCGAPSCFESDGLPGGPAHVGGYTAVTFETKTCDGVTTGAAACQSNVSDCAGFVCNAAHTACDHSCKLDSDCQTGPPLSGLNAFRCVGGACVLKKALGQPCASSEECASGACTQSFLDSQPVCHGCVAQSQCPVTKPFCGDASECDVCSAFRGAGSCNADNSLNCNDGEGCPRNATDCGSDNKCHCGSLAQCPGGMLCLNSVCKVGAGEQCLNPTDCAYGQCPAGGGVCPPAALNDECLSILGDECQSGFCGVGTELFETSCQTAP
jgi:hypothetical protein